MAAVKMAVKMAAKMAVIKDSTSTLEKKGDIAMAAPSFSRCFERPATAFFGLLLFLFFVALPAAALPELSYVLRPGPVNIQSVPPLPPVGQYPVQLVLDDDSFEGIFGVGGATAEEFLWFNRFQSPGAFTLSEIWVLFPQGQANLGDAVELVAYRDTDGNPANGAAFLGSWNATVLAADNNTFSVYTLGTPLEVPSGGEVWIGVINRWVQPGVTPLVSPATIDTNTPAGFSGFALWAGTPPSPPDLASATSIFNLNSTPGNGTFLIRAFGTSAPIVEVPALDSANLAIFAVLLTLAATFALGLRRA